MDSKSPVMKSQRMSCNGHESKINSDYLRLKYFFWCIAFLSTILFTTHNLDAQEWKRPSDLGGEYFSGSRGSVYFVDQNIGWTVGRGGSILKTTDGGINWVQQNSKTSALLNSVYFVNYDIGWAAGSYILLKTTNGGESWEAQNFDTLIDITSVHFINFEYAWIAGFNENYQAVILRTSDGGESWEAQNID
jgi:hypothetical protein